MAKRIGITEKKSAQGINTPMLLTLKVAAERLGLTVWAMRERIWAGQIPIVRFPGGRKIYIDTSDLQTFVNNNKVIVK